VRYQDVATPEPHKGFIDRSVDYESGDHNFGVRQFGDKEGRFFAIDPLWEKYRAWSPYHYCFNNPLRYVDPSGASVAASDPEGQKTILDILCEEDRKFIKFDDKGNIDRELINSHASESENFQKLQLLVNHGTHFLLGVSSGFQYADQDGTQGFLEFGLITIELNGEKGAYSLTTGEEGFQGITLLPGSEDGWNSPDNNVYVHINSNLSREGRAQNSSHELLGHAYLYALGLNPNHIFLPGLGEGNLLLKQTTQSGCKEQNSTCKEVLDENHCSFASM